MNSLLFATNTTAQALTDGQNFSFGQPIRRYGKNIQVSGGNIVINGEGYYPMMASVTLTAGATAGTFTVQLYENGVAIPGAKASGIAAANAVISLAVPGVVRIKCCEEKVITATVSGGAATVNNADIVVVKA